MSEEQGAWSDFGKLFVIVFAVAALVGGACYDCGEQRGQDNADRVNEYVAAALATPTPTPWASVTTWQKSLSVRCAAYRGDLCMDWRFIYPGNVSLVMIEIETDGLVRLEHGNGVSRVWIGQGAAR